MVQEVSVQKENGKQQGFGGPGTDGPGSDGPGSVGPGTDSLGSVVIPLKTHNKN